MIEIYEQTLQQELDKTESVAKNSSDRVSRAIRQTEDFRGKPMAYIIEHWASFNKDGGIFHQPTCKRSPLKPGTVQSDIGQLIKFARFLIVSGQFDHGHLQAAIKRCQLWKEARSKSIKVRRHQVAEEIQDKVILADLIKNFPNSRVARQAVKLIETSKTNANCLSTHEFSRRTPKEQESPSECSSKMWRRRDNYLTAEFS